MTSCSLLICFLLTILRVPHPIVERQTIQGYHLSAHWLILAVSLSPSFYLSFSAERKSRVISGQNLAFADIIVV